jgi:nitrogenase molybdenum-iron protein beta chain
MLIYDLPDRAAIPRSVNLIGLYSDDFMADADLASIRSMLAHSEISVNAVVPYDSYHNLQNIASSALNLVFEGFEPIGEALRRRFGTPYLNVVYPYGLDGSARFMNAVCAGINVSPNRFKMPQAEEAESKVRLLREILSGYADMPVAVIGDSARLRGLHAVLENELGLCVEVLADTADSEEENYEKILESNAILLFGSSFERNIAKQLGIPLIRFTYPVFDKVNLISCGYAGFSGFIRICEDLLNAILQAEPTG